MTFEEWWNDNKHTLPGYTMFTNAALEAYKIYSSRLWEAAQAEDAPDKEE